MMEPSFNHTPVPASLIPGPVVFSQQPNMQQHVFAYPPISHHMPPLNIPPPITTEAPATPPVPPESKTHVPDTPTMPESEAPKIDSNSSSNNSTTQKYLCMECGEYLSTAYSLKRHTLTHTGHKPHECSYCDKKFSHAYLLANHLNTHTGDKPHRCNECGKEFTKAGVLKRHMQIHVKQQHQCNQCQQEFPRIEILDKHLATEHNVSRLHLCLQCGKAFTLETMLNEHIESHNNKNSKPTDPNLSCDACKKNFSRIDSLTRHKKQMHNFQKDDQCSNVNEQSPYFPNNTQPTVGDNVNNYQSQGTPSKKSPKKGTVVVCPVCNKNFSRPDSLKRHMIGIHDNNREETAKNTQTETASTNKATQDMSFSGTNPALPGARERSIPCELCGLQLSTEELLYRHKMVVHPSALPQSNVGNGQTISVTVPSCHENTIMQHGSQGTPSLGFSSVLTTGSDSYTGEGRHDNATVVHPQSSTAVVSSHYSNAPVVFPTAVALSGNGNLATGVSGSTKQVLSTETIETSQLQEALNTNYIPQPEGKSLGTIYCIQCKRDFTDTLSLANHMAACLLSSHEGFKSGSETNSAPPAPPTTAPQTENVTPLKTNKAGSRTPRSRRRCEQCGKHFADSYCLKRHMLSHTGEKNHTCQMCGKKFVHSFHLTSHKKIHLGIKDFSCKVCGKGFTTNYALQRHLRTHNSSTTRQYACSYCEKSFNNETDLNQHQMTHC